MRSRCVVEVKICERAPATFNEQTGWVNCGDIAYLYANLEILHFTVPV
jgi:hypothetical protein